MTETPGAPKRSSSRTPIWLLALAVIAAGGIVAFAYFQVEPSSNANIAQTGNRNGVANDNTSLGAMATHSDPDGRFTFDAPESWTVTELPDEKAGVAVVPPGASSSRIYVKAVDNPDQLSIAERFETFDDTSRFWFTRYPHESVVVNGKMAERFAPFREAGDTHTRVEVAVQGTDAIGLLSYLYSVDDSLEVFDAIVNSFTMR